MSGDWNDREPIYRQLRNQVADLILAGTFADGATLPSVRQIATEYRINPITVSKAFQILVDEGLVEMKRGLGMFVVAGARGRLMTIERERFVKQEWPQVLRTIDKLGLDVQQLIRASENKQ